MTFVVRPVDDIEVGDRVSLIDTLPDDGPHITDDFSPSKVLHRLSEKWIGNIVKGDSNA